MLYYNRATGSSYDGFDMAVIEVQHLSKVYRSGVRANDDISLSIREGEILGLLGPNGAGKTTLVRQITGELMPTAGMVRVFDLDMVKRPREGRRMLGIVPQEAGLFDHLTLQEHLMYFGRLKGVKGHDLMKGVQTLLQELDLAGHAGKRASQLSGGLKRKLLVGIAMAGHPRALVLDEPSTGLDPRSRRELWELIRRCQRRGAAVLLTTHYMEEAENLSDRVGIIFQGRLMALGTVPELHARIANRFKLTYTLGDVGGYAPERVTVYGRNSEELRRRIDELGLEEYDIAKTNLEDIYLELTRRPLTEEVGRDPMAS